MSTARIARFEEELAKEGIDLFVCHWNSDLFWLTGLDGIFDEECAHMAAISADTCAVHTDSRYINAFLSAQAEGLAQGWTFSVEPVAAADFIAVAAADAAGTLKSSKAEPLRVGIENDVPLSMYRQLIAKLDATGIPYSISETDRLVMGMRAIKDADEIERIRASQAITDAAFSSILTKVHVGMTEAEIALALDFEMRHLGAQELAFPSIVAAQEHASSPHSTPGARVVSAGDIVLFDFGAKLDGYCSDMTRCICMGKPTARQREVYDVVLDAQTAAKAALKEGVISRDIHGIAAKTIADAGFGAYFGHALGHGVGIDIHEQPTLSPFSDRMLMAGSVVTVEPGIYIPNEFGIRIEDFGVVTEEGFTTFTGSPHELVVI